MEDRKKKHIQVIRKSWWSGPGVVDKLTSVIVWFQEQLDKVPAEYKHLATVDMSACYDGDLPSVTVEYWRPETDQELADRLVREKVAVAQAQERERQQIHALADKYGFVLLPKPSTPQPSDS